MDGLVNTFEVGDQIDSYRIDAVIAQNRTAALFRATDLRDGRTVALKVPDPELEADPSFLERFRRAAAIGEKFGHHGVMQVFNEVERSRVYMVMEWCPGEPLSKIMKEQKLGQERAIRIAVAISEALQYLHDNGVVHRSLTPENILVDAEDHIKLIDFGLAADAAARRITYTNLRDELQSVDYISPEQAAGKRSDNRSDIYSLGVMFYEMITAKLPFTGTSPMETMKARIVGHPIPPKVALPSISPQLQEAIYRALEKDPKNRYSRARDFAHDLQHLDQVGVESRVELQRSKNQRPRVPRTVLFFLLLLLVPVTILIVMVLFAQKH